MNTRDLEYLVALADHGHFGKAAEACFVSQPALSMQIKKLEETLGIKLLERTNRSVMLTDTGVIIAERARQILSQVDELRATAKAAKDPFSGEIRLGIFPTLAPYLFPHIIPYLSKKFPKLYFYLVEEKSEVLVEKLKAGLIHAAILALPVVDPGLSAAPLFDEEFLLTVSHSHPLAKLKSVTQDDFDSNTLLLLDEGHCMREQIVSFCRRTNAPETQNFRATSLEALRHMVASGAGISLMPKLSSEGCDLATFIPFNEPKPLRSIGLVWRTATSKSVLLKEVEKEIKMLMAKKKLVKVSD
jgi:LysR family hydrogen peroxide-inducible transcriptional activator